jgi:hypothetical protein
MLKLLGLILLVVLILVGALMPLKYTASMKLPGATTRRGSEGSDRSGDRADE